MKAASGCSPLYDLTRLLIILNCN